MIKLLYLTYHENVLGNGILFTQVIRMLETMREVTPKMQIILLSFLSPQLLARNWREFSRLRARLNESGIRFVYLPMVVPMKWSWGTHLLLGLWFLPVLVVVLFFQCTVIHARSYGAGLLALIVARLTGIHFVFDPRGPFPEEFSMNGFWPSDGLTYKIWKRIESVLIRSSNAVIGVTTEYREEFEQRRARMAVFVPNRTDSIRFSEAIQPGTTIGEGAPELLFTGELHSAWNDPEVIVQHYRRLLQVFPKARLRIITRANTDSLQRIFEKHDLDTQRLTVQSAAPEEMPRRIQGAALGLILCVKEKRSIWPVKFAEYIAAGVPLLVDAEVEGLLATIVRRKKLGLIVNSNSLEDYRPVKDLLHDWHVWSDRCRRYAEKRMDLNSTTRQHLRIYRQILSQ